MSLKYKQGSDRMTDEGDSHKMGEDDLEISNKSIIFIYVLLALLMGGFTGYYIKTKVGDCISPDKAPDAIVARFEKSLMFITEIRPNFIGKQDSIGSLQEFYFRYGMISQSMLKSELDLMCYGKWAKEPIPVSVESINDSINKVCSELCNPDYVRNRTEGTGWKLSPDKVEKALEIKE